MTWTFDPDNLGLVRTDGKTTFTMNETLRVERQLPTCPGCGGTITVDWTRYPSGLGGGPDEYQLRSWKCPTAGCDPAPAIRASRT